MNYRDIELIANISLSLSFVIALLFGIIETRIATRDRREKFTLQTIRSFQTREFAEIRAQLRYHKLPTNFREYIGLPTTEQAKYMQFAQEMESLGILVYEQMIDFELVKKALGSFVTNSWQKYLPVIEGLRQEYSDPLLGKYFQWLAEFMERKMITK